MISLLNIALFIGVCLLILAAIWVHAWWTADWIDPSRDDEHIVPSPGLSAVEFPEQSTVIAKDQPEYRPLPALMVEDSTGTMITCWHFTLRDRLKVLFGGKLWCSVWTFDTAISPLYFSVDKRDVLPPAK